MRARDWIVPRLEANSMVRHNPEGRDGGPAANDGMPDGLASLLRAEQELNDLVAAADRDAVALVEAARAELQAEDVAFEASLAAELEQLDATEAEGTLAAIRECSARARLDASRLAELPESRVTELAREIIGGFLAVTAPDEVRR